MKKMTTLAARLRHETRGAAMAEYALILALVVVAAAPAFAKVGHKVAETFDAVSAAFDR
jgi:Flp pilus assembly pilin Flp